MATSIALIDEVIHNERVDRLRRKIVHQRPLSEIPAGTFVSINEQPYLLQKNVLHHWTPFGYDGDLPVSHQSPLQVLTPHSIVETFRAGYVPQMAFAG